MWSGNLLICIGMIPNDGVRQNMPHLQ